MAVVEEHRSVSIEFWIPFVHLFTLVFVPRDFGIFLSLFNHHLIGFIRILLGIS